MEGGAFYVDETGAMTTVSLETSGYISAQGRISEGQGTVASANNMDLQTTQKNVYHVTGNTQINCITPGSSNAKIILIFDSNPLVKHNQTCSGGNIPLRLAGSADFSASANSVLEVYLDTTIAREVSRTSP